MNKQELSAKWSKYCNTDKLVDDMMALLKQYNHRNSEHGVCTVLDKYFTNKEPLIKLFMTSKNYIGDMRISVEKEFERNTDIYAIRNLLNTAFQRLYLRDILQFEDENGKTLFDFLNTGKKMLSIAELPDENQQKEKKKKTEKFNFDDFATVQSHKKLDAFNNCINFFYNTGSIVGRDVYVKDGDNVVVSIKKGTKANRAFNKVCAYYGVDKLHPETKVVNDQEKTVYPYDKFFAEYSDLMSNLTRKMPFIISLNPLDYLTMSFGINWRSCQNIQSGGCMGGTISYMLDHVSIITFVVEKIEGDIHKIPKVYRQMYHYDKNLFIQNRLYPQGNDGATNLYDKFREHVIEEFDSMLEAGGDWTFKVGPEYCRNHAKSAQGSQHYADYTHNRGVSVFYPVNNEPSIKNHVMTIGHMNLCVNCGKAYDDHGRLNHYYASECHI